MKGVHTTYSHVNGMEQVFGNWGMTIVDNCSVHGKYQEEIPKYHYPQYNDGDFSIAFLPDLNFQVNPYIWECSPPTSITPTY